MIETITIPAAGHVLADRIAREATTTEDGRKEKYCTVCGTVVSTESIPKKTCSHEHTETIGAVDVDCREQGYIILRCNDCGEEFHKSAPNGDHVMSQYVGKSYMYHTFHKCWVSFDLYACIYHPAATLLLPDMTLYWDYTDPNVPPPRN